MPGVMRYSDGCKLSMFVILAEQPASVLGFTVARGKIVEIDAILDPERLRPLDLAVLGEA